MPFPNGTSLGDIFDGGLPSSFRDLIDRFTTDGVTSTPFTGGTQHSGTLKSLQSDPIELGFGELNLPGVLLLGRLAHPRQPTSLRNYRLAGRVVQQSPFTANVERDQPPKFEID